jgi:hypothetical protein
MPSKLCLYAHINSNERDRYGNKRRRSDESANQPGRQSHVPGLSEEQSPIRPRFTYFRGREREGKWEGGSKGAQADVGTSLM